MNSLRDILAAPELKDVRAAVGEQEPLHETYALASSPQRQTPAWSVAECTICQRFFRRGEYLRCSQCKAAVCKTGTCKSVHRVTEHRV
ncbi:hypothetical protein AciX9_4514 (plasmid) [Granulicella tundricola MP5ACTX9]|uniref:Uncharacterized protein n=1 Tax=Granulicella tundricola (strain ATCC BAA-1859 / DSM 23138 / MP5ACTX9) TaxID=1198114 RepID=E8X7M1_GRATM|nr:hypothetical protein AciX9_4514 [Granulicella tundricola MP5ACTX9]